MSTIQEATYLQRWSSYDPSYEVWIQYGGPGWEGILQLEAPFRALGAPSRTKQTSAEEKNLARRAGIKVFSELMGRGRPTITSVQQTIVYAVSRVVRGGALAEDFFALAHADRFAFPMEDGKRVPWTLRNLEARAAGQRELRLRGLYWRDIIRALKRAGGMVGVRTIWIAADGVTPDLEAGWSIIHLNDVMEATGCYVWNIELFDGRVFRVGPNEFAELTERPSLWSGDDEGGTGGAEG